MIKPLLALLGLCEVVTLKLGRLVNQMIAPDLEFQDYEKVVLLPKKRTVVLELATVE